MLMVARKAGQEVYIGPSITIRVLEVNQWGQVRLGIEAPGDMKIWRPSKEGPPIDQPPKELEE